MMNPNQKYDNDGNPIRDDFDFNAWREEELVFEKARKSRNRKIVLALLIGGFLLFSVNNFFSELTTNTSRVANEALVRAAVDTLPTFGDVRHGINPGTGLPLFSAPLPEPIFADSLLPELRTYAFLGNARLSEVKASHRVIGVNTRNTTVDVSTTVEANLFLAALHKIGVISFQSVENPS